MPRKLRTFTTSIGFFELAVAAPSMKAAMEAWGAERNLFSQGFAEETRDPAIVAATMAQPGIVLKRSVGSKGAFREQAALPKTLPAEEPARASRSRRTSGTKVARRKVAAATTNLAETRSAERAAAAIEKVRARREAEERKREAAETRERALQAAALVKAEGALEKARQRHDAIIQEIQTERESLDRRAEAEGARWKKEKEKLEEKLRRTRV